MRCAAVDIGTNSCRLLIAEKQAEQWQTLHRGLVTTRIGEGVDLRGAISREAMDRTVRGLQELQRMIISCQVEKMRVVGTSALRDAANREEFVSRVCQELSWQVDIISGEEEAQLSYHGVTSGLTLDRPPLVVDLGGGSTEFMLEDPDPWFVSLPLGAVRAAEADMSDMEMSAVLDSLTQQYFASDLPLVVVGGTATTLAAMQLGLKVYDSRLVHGQCLTIGQIKYWRDHLASLSLEDRRRVPGLQPQRADIIVPGIRILVSIMDKLSCGSMLVSESDILDGIIAQL